MRDLTGSLFKNQKKATEHHPGATGSCLIDGKEYWVSAWTKQDKNGAPWQSLAFKLKEAKEEKNDAVETYPGGLRKDAKSDFDNFDDDIPF